MEVAFEKVKLGKEAKRQIMIKDLYALGITEYENHSLEDLDYYTLRNALSVARIRIDSDSNKWF
ncbi:hypothetical protein [Schinkia azotoformans]|uniref:hypothetical protein n=1 Tax=Schinkia azotoformans TaxID=1454 RepID=UPI002DB9D342|nr:hypothetical protein [Schinkia azotoformans]MEC1714721.1 hypothetical protein [Schinkia azotoformans]MEC1757523.1 hypothetical protein [Schinkia azotoformans]